MQNSLFTKIYYTFKMIENEIKKIKIKYNNYSYC